MASKSRAKDVVDVGGNVDNVNGKAISAEDASKVPEADDKDDTCGYSDSVSDAQKSTTTQSQLGLGLRRRHGTMDL